MKKVGAVLLVLLFGVSAAALAKTADVRPIPVKILGKTIQIRKGMTRSDAKAALSSVIKEEPSLDTAERLQYDVQLVPETAPVTILFDFDKKGAVSGFLIDSSERDQNPAAAALVNWLKANAGKSEVKKKGARFGALPGGRSNTPREEREKMRFTMSSSSGLGNDEP